MLVRNNPQSLIGTKIESEFINVLTIYNKFHDSPIESCWTVKVVLMNEILSYNCGMTQFVHKLAFPWRIISES